MLDENSLFLNTRYSTTAVTITANHSNPRIIFTFVTFLFFLFCVCFRKTRISHRIEQSLSNQHRTRPYLCPINFLNSFIFVSYIRFRQLVLYILLTTVTVPRVNTTAGYVLYISDMHSTHFIGFSMGSHTRDGMRF